MYRVKDNPDGSVSVFTNDGKEEFICKIAPRSSIKRYRNVSLAPARNLRSTKKVPLSPQRLKLSPTHSKRKPHFPKKSKTDWVSSQGVYKSDDDNYDTSSVTSYESNSSKYSHTSVESSSEPDVDCRDQLSFCRMLDLIDSKRLHGPPELLQSFPIRKISRQNRWLNPKRRFGKRTEYIGFSSLLGQRIVSGDPRSKLIESVENLTSKYGRFCNSSFVNVKPVEASAPLLRTRENRAKYPVTFKKTDGYVHEYTFNRMQRRRRAEYMKIGLNHPSYLLLLKCRTCSVTLKRLSQATISRFCNPPRQRLERGHGPAQKTQLTTRKESACAAKLPNGTSRLWPVVCLGPHSLIKSLLRKFGLA